GFIGKPETARKTRGDQYFFVNNRFIKSAYLNHAVNAAFDGIIAKDSFPGYVLYIDLDPAQIDINVHPTKQEIKFEDEKIIYAFIQAAVKHALAQFSIAPSLDFSLNADIQQLDAVSKPFTSEQQHATVSSGLYQTFSRSNQAHAIEPTEKSGLGDWRTYFKQSSMNNLESEIPRVGRNEIPDSRFQIPDSHKAFLQINNTYILVTTGKGFMVVHQQLAHERILYEKYSAAAHSTQAATQKTLFPINLELAPADAALLHDLLPDLEQIGYMIEPFGNNSFVIQGSPAGIIAGNEKDAIELLIEQFKHYSSDVKFSKREKLVRCMARQQSIKAGQALTHKEMEVLTEELFSCNTPNVSPNGAPTYLDFKEDYLDRMFGK
ncbi:MAG: mismatch repair endonuclease MutL, partial [Bacteroidota bacterium]